MTLKNLLKQNEAQIKEAESFFDDSFQVLKEFQLQNKLTPPKPPQINEISIINKNFPLNLHLEENIRNFCKSGVLRPLEHQKSREFFDDLFRSKVIEKLVEKFMVLVFLAKFPAENPEADFEGLKEKLSKNINRKYSEIFVRSPKSNNDLLNAVTFSIGYLVHMIYFQTFPLDRAIFNMRFIFDVYHIIIFHFNGIFVSDYYLQTQFERIFTSKFLDYEIIRPTPTKEENEKPNEKSFFELTKPIIESKYHEFAGELANRLRTKQKILRRRESERSIASTYSVNRKNDNKPQQAPIIRQNDNLSERMRFNCSQISPCISSIVNAPCLPHTKSKTINYSLDKSYLNKTRTFIQLYDCFQQKLSHQTKKPSKSLPKISSFHHNNENFINENVKIDSFEKANKLFKHMKDLSRRLKKEEQRYSSLNSAKMVFEYAKRKPSKNEKIPSQTEIKEPPPSEKTLKPLTLGQTQLNENFNKTFKFHKLDNINALNPILTASTRKLLPDKSPMLKSGLKVNSEKEVKRIQEKLNAHVYENGEMIDINEGLKNKVKTYFMLNDELGETIKEQKDKKREYINKYAKLINENIDENIRGINSKLEQLNKAKFYSFHSKN